MTTPMHNFTYEEFHVFVMLYAANADGKITASEESLMTAVLGHEQYLAIKQVFDQLNDSQVLEYIFSYKDKYLASETDRNTILKDMARIYAADESFDIIEQGVHKLFERMLKSH